MAEFMKAATLEPLPPGACTTVTIGDTRVAVDRVFRSRA